MMEFRFSRLSRRAPGLVRRLASTPARLFVTPVLALLGCVGSLAAHAPAHAPAQTPFDASGEPAPGVGDGDVGVVLVAHGGSAEWNAPVLELAEQVEARTGWPVRASFLMGDHAHEHRFQNEVARVVEEGAERVVVVPVLASSHSGHYDQIEYLVGRSVSLSDVMMHHLHQAGIERPSVDVPLELTPAIDASMEIAEILADRALALADAPQEQALFIVGHGPNAAEAYAGWMQNLRPVADSIQGLTGFRDVKLGLVRDDAPEGVRAEAVRRIREIIDLQHEVTGREVVVVPVLISRSYISLEKLPRDLAGLPMAYDGNGLLPHPGLAPWVERRVREATEDGADFPSAAP